MSLPSLGYKSDSVIPGDETIHSVLEKVTFQVSSFSSLYHKLRYFQCSGERVRGGFGKSLGQKVQLWCEKVQERGCLGKTDKQ